MQGMCHLSRGIVAQSLSMKTILTLKADSSNALIHTRPHLCAHLLQVQPGGAKHLTLQNLITQGASQKGPQILQDAENDGALSDRRFRGWTLLAGSSSVILNDRVKRL